MYPSPTSQTLLLCPFCLNIFLGIKYYKRPRYDCSLRISLIRVHSDWFHDHDKRLVWITLEYLQQTLKAFRTKKIAEKGLTRNNLAEKGLTYCMLGNLSSFCFRLLTFSKFLQESMGPGWDRTRNPWNCCQTRICSQTCRVIDGATRPGLPYCQPFWIQISSDLMSKRF